MTDITRIFDYQTRALRNTERRYSGQMYDAMATTIHFEYDPINFLAYDPDYVDPDTGHVGVHWIPYIMFAVQDDEGNNLVYGPDPQTSQPTFDGYTFTIPWDVTSRVAKTRRVDYQLWFVKNYVEFDPNDGVAHLASTDYILSEVDCIVIKPSIECKKKTKCCPATAPSSEPSVIGYINLWKEYGLVSPVTEARDEDGKPVLKFKTYNGNQNVDLTLDVAPLDDENKVPIEFLPTGHTAGTIPLIVGTVNNGRALVYSEALGGFVDGSAITPEGSVTSAQLDIMAQNPEQYDLKPGTVYNCIDRRQYDGNWYKAGTNWIWETDHWEPLTGGEDLDDYQLKEYRISEWQAVPDDEHYPSEKLVKDSLDALSADMEAMDEELTQAIGAVDAKADANSAAISAVEGRVEAAEGAIQGLGTRMDAAEGAITGNTVAIGALDTRMGTAETNIQANTQAVQAVAGTVDALSGTVADLGDDVQSLDTAVADLGQALDGKLDKSAVKEDPAEAGEGDVFSANATRTLLADKTDKTQAVPVWSASERYPVNATVLYADSLFISAQGENIGHDPFDTTWWTQISGSGGGGGSVMKHKTIMFGNAASTQYDVVHNLGTYDFLFSIRTNDNERRYVLADVRALTKTTARINLTDPPGENGLIINFLEMSAAAPSGTTVVENISIQEPSTVWRYENLTGKPVFVQAFQYDSQLGLYDEIRGNVDQTSADDFAVVTDTFDAPRDGEMVIVMSSLVYEFENEETWIINHGLGGYFGVQCYNDQYGMVAGNVDQDGSGVVTISWGTPMSGYAVLMEPRVVQDVAPGTTSPLVIRHDLDRLAAVQVYSPTWGQLMLDVHQNGTDTVIVEWNGTGVAGKVLII